ncbi:DUF262 domain-containing protein [Aliarcobacter butzleri]|uniref:DUF262 domain-containing protein n=1 Tax=Aliarcobacter butzleri TaxID=28197 RepID=UPI002B249D8E|nr:DUF262 domain-containing protein [Aliarcobacter butzleri]
MFNINHLLNGKIELDREDGKVSYDISGIEIPIIQRDYAQGRDTSKFIRNRFLDSIFEALSKNEILEMDFIYGSIKELKDGDNTYNIFLPLDGQQRLTTIFLLYWFLINTEELSEDKLKEERKLLSRFSYSTRSTARLFCEKMSSISYTNNVKESITSSYWFHKSYENDPTVMGMLTTLEDIQKKYEEFQQISLDRQKLLNRMDKLCFYILPLDGFDLTDELYIKMNARGKPLTDFENFKADIINWMKSEKNDDQKLFNQEVEYHGTRMPWYLSIASKFDNIWTDIFWKEAIQNEKEKDKIVDPYFLRFIKRFFLNQFIISSDKSAKDIENSRQFELLYSVGNEENIKYQSFEDYKEFITPNILSKLEKVLNLFYTNQVTIHNAIKPTWDIEDNWFLYDAKITQIQRILFFAVTKYLENDSFDEEKFKEWIRVVWNIIIDPDIRSIGAMIGALKLINKLSKGSNDICHSFSTGLFDTLIIEEKSKVHKNQLIEEKQKIQLFSQDGWQNEILKAEAHPLFQGNIGFLLTEVDNLELFIEKRNQAFLIFNKSGTDKTYLDAYRVFRYCISQFATWDEVKGFIYENDAKNWQLSLRRNESVKKTILELCALSKTEIEKKIEDSLNGPSTITGWENEERLQLIHFNLYNYLELIKCTQNKKISELRWRHDLVYFVRRGAWHDKILIDGYRHIVINKFCELVGVNNDKKCGSSNFILGEQIELIFNNYGIDWKIVFEGDNKINIYKYNLEEEICIEKEISAKNNDEAEALANDIKELILNESI